ncbi:GNAT family N-acetyltransferase [Chitinophaga sp. S165]|uniref:GNAT family N-acetyltransferase n=1 Tax=Chitinophaga sp. S165 TaxID=2135462 RepID=UPI000D714A6E|nr:GNAT family N-acetyltransferase [Chitinophaga sp. S165]PWV47725.1 RimJ/RimL family protein N-acetyltransferase [Chitinophaga sp. S165]
MLQTARLIIQPLTYDQLVKYIRADHSLEAELQLKPVSMTISEDLKDALEQAILPNVADSQRNYLYYTLWTIISRDENNMVGDICFVGEPNEAGEVEIGYGTYEHQRGKGYMTEAVKAMIEWTAQQPGIKGIIASTLKDNTPSYAVLQKNGFMKTGESADLFHWRHNIR